MIADSSILTEIIQPERATLSEELARYFLSLDFLPEHREKANTLSEKARLGTLSDSERVELDDLVETNAFLGMLHSKARVSLQKHSSAA